MRAPPAWSPPRSAPRKSSPATEADSCSRAPRIHACPATRHPPPPAWGSTVFAAIRHAGLRGLTSSARARRSQRQRSGRLAHGALQTSSSAASRKHAAARHPCPPPTVCAARGGRGENLTKCQTRDARGETTRAARGGLPRRHALPSSCGAARLRVPRPPQNAARKWVAIRLESAVRAPHPSSCGPRPPCPAATLRSAPRRISPATQASDSRGLCIYSGWPGEGELVGARAGRSPLGTMNGISDPKIS
jgi:hypothetical protein